jgi:uncharacterized protein (TIGR02996 family)
VTTEEDFGRAINADPEDWQALLVFSDWLRERNDPRADGYAALARFQKRPRAETHSNSMREDWRGDWFIWGKATTARRAGASGPAKESEPDVLPPDWYDEAKEFNQLPEWQKHAWSYFRTRSGALDAAARAFARLPDNRRTELLTAPVGQPARAVKKSAKPKKPKNPKN